MRSSCCPGRTGLSPSPLRSKRSTRTPPDAHRRAKSTHSRDGPTWSITPALSRIDGRPAASEPAGSVTIPKSPSGPRATILSLTAPAVGVAADGDGGVARGDGERAVAAADHARHPRHHRVHGGHRLAGPANGSTSTSSAWPGASPHSTWSSSRRCPMALFAVRSGRTQDQDPVGQRPLGGGDRQRPQLLDRVGLVHDPRHLDRPVVAGLAPEAEQTERLLLAQIRPPRGARIPQDDPVQPRRPRGHLAGGQRGPHPHARPPPPGERRRRAPASTAAAHTGHPGLDPSRIVLTAGRVPRPVVVEPQRRPTRRRRQTLGQMAERPVACTPPRGRAAGTAPRRPAPTPSSGRCSHPNSGRSSGPNHSAPGRSRRHPLTRGRCVPSSAR